MWSIGDNFPIIHILLFGSCSSSVLGSYTSPVKFSSLPVLGIADRRVSVERHIKTLGIDPPNDTTTSQPKCSFAAKHISCLAWLARWPKVLHYISSWNICKSFSVTFVSYRGGGGGKAVAWNAKGLTRVSPSMYTGVSAFGLRSQLPLSKSLISSRTLGVVGHLLLDYYYDHYKYLWTNGIIN